MLLYYVQSVRVRASRMQTIPVPSLPRTHCLFSMPLNLFKADAEWLSHHTVALEEFPDA